MKKYYYIKITDKSDSDRIYYFSGMSNRLEVSEFKGDAILFDDKESAKLMFQIFRRNKESRFYNERVITTIYNKEDDKFYE